MTHVNGDAALDMVVSAYEQALGDQPSTADRAVTGSKHCSLAGFGSTSSMARVAVQPSFLMNHVYYWGRSVQGQHSWTRAGQRTRLSCQRVCRRTSSIAAQRLLP